MRRNPRKLGEQPKPEDYREAAENALELAKALAGQGGLGDQDFLARMARSDELADHDGTTCGHCYNMILGAEVAREMIEAGEYEDVVSKWAAEAKRRWEKSKFFQLWQKEQKAGRDPRQAFKDRGVGAVTANPFAKPWDWEQGEEPRRMAMDLWQIVSMDQCDEGDFNEEVQAFTHRVMTATPHFDCDYFGNFIAVPEARRQCADHLVAGPD